MIINKSNSNSTKICVDYLTQGKIVILPTDTVYGFSGIVENKSNTHKKICKIKGRDESKKFIRLIFEAQEIKQYSNDKIPDILLEKWPGALTIIVNDKIGETVAYRCPNDIWLRNIIRMCKYPIYSTSVNKSNFPPMNKIDEIINTFENEADLIIADGDKTSLPSTIVSITTGQIKIIREGSVKI